MCSIIVECCLICVNVLTVQVMELKMKCDAVEKRESEKRQLEEKKHQEEMSALKKTNQQLKTQLEGIIVQKK